MSATPTGRVRHEGGRPTLVLTRTFRAPVEDVWAAVTEPERLERWIGTFTGDPAVGHVLFRMTAEEGMPEERFEIRECRPPHVLAVTSRVGDDQWHLVLRLTEDDGVTTLTFTQPAVDPEQVGDIGPGWEYYLDRLVAAETGGVVGSIDFGDYQPAMSSYYRTLAV